MRDLSECGPVPVLYIDPVAEMGGAEVVLRDLIERIDRDRYYPVLACLEVGPFVEEARRLGLPAYGLRPHRARQIHRMAVAMARLAWIARRHEVGIVHANLGNGLLYGWAAARPSRARLVWHVHDPHLTEDAFGRFFATTQRWIRPDHTLFATTTVGAPYLHTYPRLGDHTTIFGGVSTEARGDAVRARTRLGLPPDAPVILALGRLQRFKGQHLLLDAFPRVLASHPRARLVIVGGTLFGQEPQYAEALRQRASGPDLAHRVHVTGFVGDDQKHDLLEACSLLAHPAHTEPLGMSVLEAMAHAKPVVSFDAAGPAHTVVHDVTGLLVPRGDSDGLANAIIELLGDPDRSAAMGDAGRRRVEATFSVEATVRRIEEVYEQVLEL